MDVVIILSPFLHFYFCLGTIKFILSATFTSEEEFATRTQFFKTPFSSVTNDPHTQFEVILPLHRLPVVQKRTEAAAAFKNHRAKAPIVYSNRVWLVVKQLRSLQTNRSNYFLA